MGGGQGIVWESLEIREKPRDLEVRARGILGSQEKWENPGFFFPLGSWENPFFFSIPKRGFWGGTLGFREIWKSWIWAWGVLPIPKNDHGDLGSRGIRNQNFGIIPETFSPQFPGF